MAFVLGPLEDSNLRVRPIADCRRAALRRAGLSRDRPACRWTGQDSDRPAARLPDAPLPGGARIRLDAGDARGAAALRGDGHARIGRRRRADRLGAGRPRHRPEAGLRDRRAPRLGRAGPGLRSDPAAGRSSSPASSRTSGCRTRRAGCSSTSWSPPAAASSPPFSPGWRPRPRPDPDRPQAPRRPVAGSIRRAPGALCRGAGVTVAAAFGIGVAIPPPPGSSPPAGRRRPGCGRRRRCRPG